MNTITSFSSTTFDIAKRLAGDIYKKYPFAVNAMRNKAFLTVDTGVHPKTIADWNRMGLLLAARMPNKHHRFTLTEFVWILMLERMRGFNLSYELIASFREECIQPQSFSFNDIIAQPNFIDQLAQVMPDIPKDWLAGFFSDPTSTSKLNEVIMRDFPVVSALDTLILVSLFMENPVSIIMDETGRGSMLYPEVFRAVDLDTSELERLLYSTHVCISISEMVAKAMGIAPLEKLSGELSLLSEDEAKVLAALRGENLKSVTVRFDKKGHLDFLELVTDQKVDKGTRLLELILTNGYQDITVKTQKGQIIFCENKKKIKLK